MKSMIANRLQKARNDKGLNQTEVYKLTGINNKTLSGYENEVSEPDLETLTTLATLYGVSTDYLLGRDSTSITTNSDQIIETDWPEVSAALAKASKALRRCGKKPTEAERKRIAQIILLAVDVPEDEE